MHEVHKFILRLRRLLALAPPDAEGRTETERLVAVLENEYDRQAVGLAHRTEVPLPTFNHPAAMWIIPDDLPSTEFT